MPERDPHHVRNGGDWRLVGADGHALPEHRDALWRLWLQGHSSCDRGHEIWTWPKAARAELAQQLCKEAHEMRVRALTEDFQALIGVQRDKSTLEERTTVNKLKLSKKVIACTTSGAAKHRCGTSSSCFMPA